MVGEQSIWNRENTFEYIAASHLYSIGAHHFSCRLASPNNLGVRSHLPPNKGDRSAAYKLKEKLEMYQAELRWKSLAACVDATYNWASCDFPATYGLVIVIAHSFDIVLLCPETNSVDCRQHGCSFWSRTYRARRTLGGLHSRQRWQPYHATRFVTVPTRRRLLAPVCFGPPASYQNV